MAEAIVRHRKVGERREDFDIAEMIQAEMEGEGEGEGEVDKHGNKRLTEAETKALLEKYDKNELPEKIIPKWRLFLDQFCAPMPIKIWLAIIIEAFTNWIDMGILLVIQFKNASISFYELNKVENAVKATRNGNWTVLDAVLLVPGNLVLLAAGSGELEMKGMMCVSLCGSSIVLTPAII